MQNQQILLLLLNFQTSSWSCLFSLSFKENKRKIRGIFLFAYFSFSDLLGCVLFFFFSRDCLFSESSAIFLTALFSSKPHLQIFTEEKVHKSHPRKNPHQQVSACWPVIIAPTLFKIQENTHKLKLAWFKKFGPY